jgi:hypothetical protein
MITRLKLLVAGTLVALFAGCGPSTCTSAAPKLAARADVTVTVDGIQHACVVALATEAQGSVVPCGDVVPFVRDELRLPSGSIYDVRTISDVKEEEIAAVGAKLKDAGYRFIGGRRVPF